MHPLHFALVVAIWRYPGGYAQLDGPKNDAAAFKGWLLDPQGGGVPEENVRLCLSPEKGELDLNSARPTKIDVDLCLEALRNRARNVFESLSEIERPLAPSRARLYVFVAGHGVMPEGGTGALLDAVARPGGTSHLDLGKYVQWLAQDGTFGEVVVFADCCRNYDPLVEARGPDLDRAAQLGVRVFHLIGHATTGGAESFEDGAADWPVDQRRGIFSNALVDGLRGAAVHPAKGHVTPRRLHEYVKERVIAATRHRPPHQRQNVDTVGNFDLHDMTLGPRRPVRHHPVTLHLPRTVTGEVQLIAPDGGTMTWDAADGPWRVRLYDGLWRVEPSHGFTDEGVFEVNGSGGDVHIH